MNSYLTWGTPRKCNGTFRQGDQWSHPHQQCISCGVVEWQTLLPPPSPPPCLSLSPILPDGHLIFSFLLFVLSLHRLRGSRRRLPSTGLLLFYFSPLFGRRRGEKFPSHLVQAAGVTRPSFSPPPPLFLGEEWDNCWWGRTETRTFELKRRRRKGVKEEGSAAGMEENSLPGATCKSFDTDWRWSSSENLHEDFGVSGLCQKKKMLQTQFGCPVLKGWETVLWIPISY